MFKSEFKKSKSGVYNEIVNMENKLFLICDNFIDTSLLTEFFIPVHKHSQLEINLIVEGSFFCNLNDRRFLAYKGDIFLVLPNISHTMSVNEVDSKMHTILIDFSVLNSRFIDIIETQYVLPMLNCSVNFFAVIASDVKMYDLCMKLVSLKNDKCRSKELYMKACLYEIIGILWDKYVLTEQTKTVKNNKKNDFVKKIMDLIENNYSDQLSVSAISSELGVTPSYFCKIFSECTGKTFVDYLNYTRIMESLAALVQPNIKISEVATAYGFNDINYFSRVFKKYMLMSPCKYINQKSGRN